MKAFLLRDLDPAMGTYLRKRAAHSGASLNEVLLALLASAMEQEGSRVHAQRNHMAEVSRLPCPEWPAGDGAGQAGTDASASEEEQHALQEALLALNKIPG